jgi:hypothetical protein
MDRTGKSPGDQLSFGGCVHAEKLVQIDAVVQVDQGFAS